MHFIIGMSWFRKYFKTVGTQSNYIHDDSDDINIKNSNNYMLQFASICRFSGKRSIKDINDHIYAISSVWIDQKYVILQKHFSVFLVFF